MRLAYLLIAALSFVACADPGLDDAGDGEAQTAADQPVGKEDAASFAGVYRMHATTRHDGDVPNLELMVTNKPGLPTTYSYVRARCYHNPCSLQVAETDTYSVYHSTTGKTYLRFWSFTVTTDPNNGPMEHPLIADVYEIKSFSGGIKLRKSFTTRWQALYTATDAQLCSVSQGTWASGTCTCSSNGPSEFVRGSGGCIVTPGADESNCDASDGMWTDDDATLIGSYCRCGDERYVDSTGSCTAI